MRTGQRRSEETLLPPSARRLIVNADDFGQSGGVNRGVIAAHEQGIVTSASLMVRWPAAGEAANYGRAHPPLSLGLHVDLGEWRHRDGAWEPVHEVVPPGDADAVEAEIYRQLELFRALVGREPTHLDSHQHVHREAAARSVMLELAKRLSVPLRHFAPGVTYCGGFYGQTETGEPFPDAITVEGLQDIFRHLDPGVTELGCHPATGDDLPDTMYRSERIEETRVLCDSRVRAALEAAEVVLISFTSVPSAPSA